MSQILLLTNNILSEQKFQEMIQNLGHEVYCSSSLIKNRKISNSVLSNFSIIIFSDTVSNIELETILKDNHFDKQVIIRRGLYCPSKEQKKGFLTLGVTDFISNTVSADELRECLSNRLISSNKYLNSDHSDLLDTLSTKESEVMVALKESNSSIVSRETLCRILWNEPLNNSRKAHLSTLIRNITVKLQKTTMISKPIKTVWGKGYCLCEELKNAQPLGREDNNDE
ncbi:helix-turn-helix domain-containing protein [Enterococcus gilvus]|uniref:winged helix-turn-helix domain-containing protein n=1 Tax=Enterococcus gilvus TaxID=160453 RepID=UPI003D6A2EB2